MTDILNASLLAATRLTAAGRLTEAAATLQRMLGARNTEPGTVAPAAPAARREPPTLDGVAEPAGQAQSRSASEARPTTVPGTGAGHRFVSPTGLRLGPTLPRGGTRAPSRAVRQVAVPEGARFLAASFSNKAGSRPYKLYVPAGYRSDQPAPLVVMLHGCTQSPDDFAIGTRMNAMAEEHTCLVVYPGQTAAANVQKCWNWFSAGDQQRGRGEPALIAGITREIMRDYTIDRRRVYVAGLSAGGAAAAIMGETYPDLYAAIGVHSGLACGAASDMTSAFAAMQGAGAQRPASATRSGQQRPVVPVIVFHGERDTTVNPRNAAAVVTQSAGAAALAPRTEEGQVPGGHAFRRTLHTDPDGRTVIEQWAVRGAGHAWFGGSPAGSYTDPRGPDASREMLRFFFEHQHPAPGGLPSSPAPTTATEPGLAH